MLTGLLLVASSPCFFVPPRTMNPEISTIRKDQKGGTVYYGSPFQDTMYHSIRTQCIIVSGYNVSQFQDPMYHSFVTQCIIVLRYNVSWFQDTMYRGFRIQCITARKAWWQEYEATATLYLKLESLTRRMLVLSSLSLFPQFQKGLWPIRWCQPQKQLNLLSQVYLPGSTLRKIQLCVFYVILNPGNLTMRANHDGCSRRLNQ